MSNIPVQMAGEEKALPAPWLGELEKFFEQVRQKAFDLFERNGREGGHDVEHWLEAERQLVSMPGYEISDAAEKFDVRVAVPGFEAKEIELTALPGALLVKAEATHEREQKEGERRYTEFSGKSQFRHIPFPEPVDTGRVTATLDKGALKITAYKAAEKKQDERKTASATA